MVGLRAGAQKWIIRQVEPNNVETDPSTSFAQHPCGTRTGLASPVHDTSLHADRRYQLDLVVGVGKVTLYADGHEVISWQRASSDPPITGGRVGVMVRSGVAEFQELEQWDVGRVTKTYAIGGQRVALRRDNALYYVHTDHLGSSSLLTNEQGHEVTGTRLRYYAYGGPRPGSASSTHDAFALDYTAATYTGQERDVSTGLMYYGARFYDPALGRFVQPDTVVPSPGDPQSLNRYAYVNNNPLRYTDSSGHVFWQGGGGGDTIVDYQPADNTEPWPSDVPISVADTGSAPEHTLWASMGGCTQCHTAVAFGHTPTNEEMLWWLEDYQQNTQWFVNTCVSSFLGAGAINQLIRQAEFTYQYYGSIPGVKMAPLRPVSGQVVYRTWGSEPPEPDIPGAGPWGHSWSPIDPRTVSDYRSVAGLPSNGTSGAYNRGRFVTVGTVDDVSGIIVRNALALDNLPGGLPEFLVPNPQQQITVIGVYGINPPY